MKALLVTACGCTREMEIGEGGPPGHLVVQLERLSPVSRSLLDRGELRARAFVLIGRPTAAVAVYQEELEC